MILFSQQIMWGEIAFASINVSRYLSIQTLVLFFAFFFLMLFFDVILPEIKEFFGHPLRGASHAFYVLPSRSKK